MPLFNRQVELTIGPADASSSGILISGLRVTFKVKKTEKREKNSCSVEVYGLSQANRRRIEDLDNLLVLKAGYLGESGPKNLFVGNLTRLGTSNKRDGPEVITKLEVADGEKALRDTALTLTYAAGTLAKQVLGDIVDRFPLALYYLDQGITQDAEFQNGFAFSGSFGDAMDKLGAKLDFNWSVQDNELQILKNGNANKEPGIHLSKDTGMIGAPERLQDKGKAKTVEKQNRPGWKVESLLMPNIRVGTTMLITSPQIETDTPFRVVKVEHIGDTHGREWTSKMEITEIG